VSPKQGPQPETGFVSEARRRKLELEGWRQKGFAHGKTGRSVEFPTTTDAECLAAYAAGLRIGKRERDRSTL
jgi:hypothetical protein